MTVGMTFLLGFLIYTIGAFLSNSSSLKESSYYIYYGLCLSLVANFLWFSMIQKIQKPSDVLLYGLYWDMVILFSFISVPLIFYGARFKMVPSIGIFLMVLGFLLTKVKV